ncbi:MAG: hypothetical protein B5766_03785 [Candidatus Lumbricidophila eiseniae]|uniref:Uncharacterized protein n=1 Tax=Candidatus Lumbricidiphila eiseniae TaxID=1969409 RepID=A0A2A6FTR7_9MICO|nr:MAG: hypothetical protein B5766_03785 [Candidatus Lumbricidophila eiseniae]
MPTFTVPTFTAPRVTVPTFTAPRVTVPTFTAPRVTVPTPPECSEICHPPMLSSRRFASGFLRPLPAHSRKQHECSTGS